MITDHQLLDVVLGSLAEYTDMAVLHRERDVANHLVRSDVDLCVSEAPLSIISAVAPTLESHGVLPIMVFHYDRGSYSFFFSNRLGTGAAQVDVLHDPRGAARYGIRTDALLARRVPGIRWPTIEPLDEALYVLRKRLVKADLPRLVQAREQVLALGSDSATRRVPELFGRRAIPTVQAALAQLATKDLGSQGTWRSRMMRPSRVVRRCGYWAHVTGESAHTEARLLTDHMAQLISARFVSDPGLDYLINNLWRPRLVVSAGGLRRRPRPDALLETGATGDSAGALVRELVSAMHRRVVRTFKLGQAGIQT